MYRQGYAAVALQSLTSAALHPPCSFFLPLFPLSLSSFNAFLHDCLCFLVSCHEREKVLVGWPQPLWQQAAAFLEQLWHRNWIDTVKRMPDNELLVGRMLLPLKTKKLS